MDGRIRELLIRPIHLTQQLRKAVGEADSFRQECVELGKQLEKLAILLRKIVSLTAHDAGGICERPTCRIMLEVTKTLDKALTLVKKCKNSGILKRVITITSATDFRKVNLLLENSIGDVRWLLNISASGEDRPGMEGLPPIASTDPMLAWVWGQIAHLQSGSSEDKEEGASYLASLAADNERNGKIIIEEGGVPPLLRLLQEGTKYCQLAAVTALANLASDQERVRQIVAHGAIPVFVEVLTDGHMKLQAKVAWVLARMVSLDLDFAGENIVRPLVSLLISDAVDLNSRPMEPISLHSLVRTSIAANRSGTPGEAGEMCNGGQEWHQNYTLPQSTPVWLDSKRSCDIIGNERQKGQYGSRDKNHPCQKAHQHTRSISDSYYNRYSTRDLRRREREKEDPETKRELKESVTQALWKLAENNDLNSKRITETKALLCLAKLIEQETGEVQRNSVMAIMEIAAAAERDVDLRRFAFKTNSPAAKAVVDQLLRVIDDHGCSDLKVPCLRAVGCLARTFPARETRVIGSLVWQLSHANPCVSAEAAIALEKFARTDNFLHMEHSTTILDALAVPHLMQLITLEDKNVQLPALILLSYLALHVGNNEAFGETAVLKALESVARSNISETQSVRDLLSQAIKHLELYRAARHSHQSIYH